jgi:uncharacterized protein (DUF58 family)
MTDIFYPFLIILLLIAAFLGEDFTLTLIYLLLGALIAGRWWSGRALAAVKVHRNFPNRAFLGEQVTVQIKVTNSGLLPLVWLHMRDSIPPELAYPAAFTHVLTLGPQASARFEYGLEGRKRGLYSIGPLQLTSGDILGLADPRRLISKPDSLVVYPKIIPLVRLPVISHSPLGTLPHRQPLFEDPSRSRGKRDYVAGDSLRRVDWKASAATGRLQVKLFEPSIALEAAICLNLNGEDYDLRTRIDTTELAIVVAASLANWVVARRQAAGLMTNGADVLQAGAPPPAVLPGRGRGHLMRLLDILARIQIGTGAAFPASLRRESIHFSWGTTLLVVTGRLDQDLFEALFAVRRLGMDAMLILVGRGAVTEEDRRRVETFGFPLSLIQSEADLEMWRV